MGFAGSVGDEFVGRENAETRLSAEVLARRRQLVARLVGAAIVLTQLVWFAGLFLAARVFIFS
jgi:hypothetical protein